MKNFKALFSIIKKVLAILSPKQKRGSVLVFFCIIICSLLDLLGVSAIYPLLEVMMDESALKSEWYSAWIYNIWPDISFGNVILLLGLAIIIIYLAKNAMAILCYYQQYTFAAKFKRELSTLMLSSYMKRPYEYFVNTNSAVMLRGILNDTDSTYVILCNMFQLVADSITVVFIAVYLAATDWFIAVWALGLMVVCFIGVTFSFKPVMKRSGRKYREAIGGQNKASYQAINGAKEVMVMDRRELFVDSFETAARNVESTSWIKDLVAVTPDRILEGVCIGGFIGVVCIRVAINPNATTMIPVLGSFAIGAFKILPSVAKIANKLNSIVFNNPGLDECYSNIMEARRLEAELKKNEEEALGKNSNKSDVEDIKEADIEFTSDIAIKNITWRYKNSEDDVLKNLNLNIKKGESIAFIGSSGSGKTTLSDIILGLLKPQEGQVEMDGIDIYSIPHQWAKIIGYVPQSVFLIDDTIRANVAFGMPREFTSDEKVWKALEQAQLDSFVRDLPDGLDTIVGERGVKFSGGQRQRIAIARALYEDPDILVLDEATAALDNDTETAVMEAIDALQGSKTLIIVAHRLTTIRNCDKIYEIGGGVATLRDKAEVLGDI